jgi:hypothetical protein
MHLDCGTIERFLAMLCPNLFSTLSIENFMTSQFLIILQIKKIQQLNVVAILAKTKDFVDFVTHKVGTVYGGYVRDYIAGDIPNDINIIVLSESYFLEVLLASQWCTNSVVHNPHHACESSVTFVNGCTNITLNKNNMRECAKLIPEDYFIRNNSKHDSIKPNTIITLKYSFSHIHDNITYLIGFSIVLNTHVMTWTTTSPLDYNVNSLVFEKNWDHLNKFENTIPKAILTTSKLSLNLKDVVSSIKRREFYSMPIKKWDNNVDDHVEKLELRKQKLISRGWTYIESPK